MNDQINGKPGPYRTGKNRRNFRLFFSSLPVVILLIFILTVPGNLRAQQPVLRLNLSAALDSAMLNNAQIRQYQEKVEQKKYLKKSAVGNFFPSLNVNGGFTWFSQNAELNMSMFKEGVDNMLIGYGALIGKGLQLSPAAQQILVKTISNVKKLPPVNIEINGQNYPNFNVTLFQPIFTGGKIIAGKKFATAELNYSDVELQKTKNEIIKETIDRYYAVVLLKAVVKTRKQVVAGMKRHEQDAEKAIKIGMIPPYTRLRAEVAVANAQRDLSDDENKLKLAKMALKTSMGMHIPTDIEVTDTLKFQVCPLNISQLKSDAVNHQPVFRMIEEKKVMVKQKYNLDIAAFMPQIGAWGTYSTFRDKYPVIPSPFVIGVQAKINLFRGAKKINELKATRHLAKEVDAAEQYAHEQVNLWVNKSYNEVLNKQERYRKLQPTIALAKKNYEITMKSFHEGMAKSTDVIDARLLYEKAQIEAYHTLYDYYVALSNLYLATGNPEKLLNVLIHDNNQ